MSWLLDTDVISQPAKRRGDVRVVAWLARERDQCYTSAVVIARLAYWVRSKEGRQREQLQAWLTRLGHAMQGRIYGFNVAVAHVSCRAGASARRSRSPNAGRRQLHRRDGTAHHRDRQRAGFPSARIKSLQSV